jgi:Phage integrase, N-terminal SAM-like domain
MLLFRWYRDAGGAPREKRMTVTVPETRSGQPKQLDAGGFQPEVSSFRLHLAAEGKAVKTVRTYTEAVQWFAAAHLRRKGNCSCWEEVKKRDVQEWVAWLLGRYSAAYARNQYRALRQFFKWLAGEEDIPDPMAGLKPPRVTGKPVPVFTGDELRRLERACTGRGFGHAGGLRYRCDGIYSTFPISAIVGDEVNEKYEPVSGHGPVVATFNLEEANPVPAAEASSP